MANLKDYARGGRRPHRAAKIVLGIVLGLLIVCGVVFALNYNTITLLLGKGKIGLKDIGGIKSAASGILTQVSEASQSGGGQTLTGTSADGAVKMTVTQTSDGKKTVNAQADLRKLAPGADLHAIKSGDLSGLSALKSQADKYLAVVVPQDQVTGIEAYLLKEASAQYKSHPNAITIDKDFGNVSLHASADMHSGQGDLTMTQK